MSKRAADASEDLPALKAGERPVADAPPDEVGEFEDEFEDEFESEDEVLEAGVDGRPDAEREEEEKGLSTLYMCVCVFCAYMSNVMGVDRYDGSRPRDVYSRPDKIGP